MNRHNFEIISSFVSSLFHTLGIFGHKMQMHTLTQLKLDTHKGLIKHIFILILIEIQ